MSVEFHIDIERKLIIGQVSGEVEHQELQDVVQEMVRHPDYDPTFNEIWDIRKVIKVKSFLKQTMARVENEHRIRRIKTPNREALIVKNTLQHKIASLYAVLAENIPLKVEVFYDYERGLRWVSEE
ncbi:MAG: hypothetical protein ABIA75_06875 [Candidatus Neomarinimicrobiota bacterium]